MNDNLTHIGVLVDRSGSMNMIRSDTEGGLRTFLQEQAAQPGEARVSLAQFDNYFESVYENAPIESVHYTLVPRGMTALLDAIGVFITDLGAMLAKIDEADRPSKVVVVILTDGAENSSREWTVEKVRELVTQQERDYNWEFVFMGANIDAIATAGQFGIKADNAIDYGATKAGVGNVFAAASNYVSTTRSGVVASFSDADRRAARGQPTT